MARVQPCRANGPPYLGNIMLTDKLDNIGQTLDDMDRKLDILIDCLVIDQSKINYCSNCHAAWNGMKAATTGHPAECSVCGQNAHA